MTTEPMAPSEPIRWTDHDDDETYTVLDPQAFEDYSQVDSTTVDVEDEVPDAD